MPKPIIIPRIKPPEPHTPLTQHRGDFPALLDLIRKAFSKYGKEIEDLQKAMVDIDVGDKVKNLEHNKADVSALETEILRAKEAETVLADALAKKQGVLEAGENITIVGNVISATGGGGDLTAVGLEVNEYGQLCVTFETEE
jgi:hypothetical protein